MRITRRKRVSAETLARPFLHRLGQGEEAARREVLPFVPGTMLLQEFPFIDAYSFGQSGAPAAVRGSVRQPGAIAVRAAARARPVAPAGDEFGPNAIT
ncbi:hypothetical protein [Burkholderia pyrrocinia]|uniref:hypothetical protein n=1 Tax=Burkholderia pyrrocinia TaxID=60550 RepID=UPI001BD04A3A|nr:hypothetical protein [Burkholderia pyrrocinia]QVN22269.1 hypothetical protein JYG32_23190 [Burkholderia pyrrocinia]